VDSAPNEQWDKERWYATDLGGCLGGAYFRRKGETPSNPPDARSLRIMRMGKKIEEMVVEDFQNYFKDKPEILLLDTQGYLLDEELSASARYDLLIVHRNLPPLVYEIKSVNSKAFWWMAKEGFKIKPEHELQIQWYLKKLIEKYPDIEGRVLYVSRDDLVIQELNTSYNPEIAKQSEEKFRLLNECWRNQTLPPVEPAVVFNDANRKWQVNYKARYCSHHSLCLGNVNWGKEAELKVAELNSK
ncbi:MAG: hypothetical protein AABY22_29390, partial [Nanoarchaeota archaeon]